MHRLFLQNTIPGTQPTPELLHGVWIVLVLTEQAQTVF